ncbi:hypothetical protein ACWIGI_31820 [Nocardia sp. NPDC055321]
MDLPAFYFHRDRTLWLEEAADGSTGGFALDRGTGEFVAASRAMVQEVRGRAASSESFPLDFENFVLGTERLREEGPVEDGTIAALYQVTSGIRVSARDDGRQINDEEAALITGIHHRTFMRWEELQSKRPKAVWYQPPVGSRAGRRRWFRWR